MSHLLIISHDIVGSRMAGVGIRYYEMARALSATHQITVAAPAPCDLLLAGVRTINYREGGYPSLAQEVREAEAVLCYPGTLCNIYDILPDTTPVIVDGYDLDILEQLVIQARQRTFDVDKWRRDTNAYVLKRGDFFICATNRQRDWWLGGLDAANRINLSNYMADPTFRRLIDIVPFGIPPVEPQSTRRVIRRVLPNVGDKDDVVLWGGGVWEWFDPMTLVRAAQLLARSHPHIKFVFPGVAHPASQGGEVLPVQAQFQNLCKDSGLLDTRIFLGAWAPYADWQNYLLESTVGISLHHDHVEAHFSARTRVMSYIWAALPMVLTQGDELSALVAQHGVAVLVAHGDAPGVAQAILRAITISRDRKCQTLFRGLQSQFSWRKCVEPIDRFLQRPSRAADIVRGPAT